MNNEQDHPLNQRLLLYHLMKKLVIQRLPLFMISKLSRQIVIIAIFIVTQQFLIVYCRQMSMNRIRLTEGLSNNQSFTHQHSVNQQFDQKHKKKTSIYQKQSRTPNFHRLKTDEKQSSGIYKNQPLNSGANSIHLVHSAFSTSKLAKPHHKMSVPDQKKGKKTKQTVSVINLSKNLEESKAKISSTATKRKQSSVDFSEKLKEKLQDFKIISSCLEEYVKQERRNSNQANLHEIVKIIGAFNRSQIAPISKPLERLIGEIVSSIQNCLPQAQLKSILKKSISFESPHQRRKSEQQGTVKKGIQNRQLGKLKVQNVGDVKRLQQNLTRLKYQSNRLKYFLQEIANKNADSNKKGQKGRQIQKDQEQKLQQLRQLKEIAQQQARLIKELEDSSDGNDTFRSQSSN